MAVLLWKSFHRITNGRLLQQRTVSLYNHTHGFEEEEIRKKLQQFTGGSINLSKEDDGIGILTLNNPKLMNAFTGTMMIELQERIAELENWKDGKGLIVHGAENTFCSGSDLNAVRMLSSPQSSIDAEQASQDNLTMAFQAALEKCSRFPEIGQFGLRMKEDGMNMCMFMQNILTRLMRLPLITVALVEGKALGGGAELTTACDFRLMTPESEIRFVHKQMGLVPGWGGAARLIQILGSSSALKLLSGAVKVQPESALHIGLAEAILPSSDKSESLEETRAWLKQYTKGPAEVIQAVKKVIATGRELQLEAALRTEKEIFGTVWGGPVNIQALTQRTKHK